MKAKCVSAEDGDITVTVGKVYEVEEYDNLDSFPYRIVDDNGNLQWEHKDNFQLLPDVPDAPKSEWMRCDCDVFVNMTTGLQVRFVIAGERRVVYVFSIHNPNFDKFQDASGKFADSFAALVGYDWPSAGKEM